MRTKQILLSAVTLLFAATSFAQNNYGDNYRNRQEDRYSDRQENDGYHRQEDNIKPNIVSFAPVLVNENGFGFGISYERFLDNSGWVSVNIPAALTFNPSQSNYYGTPRMDPMFYLQPGIKLYTNLNSYRKLKCSLGPNIIMGVGTGRTDDMYNYPSSNTDPYSKRTRLLMGAVATVGGNMFISHYLYLGFDFSLGCSYVNSYDGHNMGVTPLSQASFRMGYRYANR